MLKSITIIKANNEKELFNINKLKSSLIRAGADTLLTEQIAEQIEHQIHDGMSTGEIYRHAFDLLHRAHRPVAMRYSLRRSLLDLGPSGFPFEKFIGELFRQKGYSVTTDTFVHGRCVEHEMDVVAHNDEKLIMCEVKFHNQLGLKSDLKVALYVKARFDDLMRGTFAFGGKERKLDEGWLITNTKFTSSAIKYAECENLKIIGWNYPEKDSLVKMIEQSGLHPLTCLSSLKTTEKQTLMNKGVVLCSALRDNPHTLKELGLRDNEIQSVVEEANMICPVR
jgi:hypothetical protein